MPCAVAADLARWRAEIPGTGVAAAAALSGFSGLSTFSTFSVFSVFSGAGALR